MLDNMYDLVWEAEFKNLVTPEIVALKFNVEETPFGIPLKRRVKRSSFEPGDIVQIGTRFHMRLEKGFRELEV